jgi:hypothetical protein
VAQAPLDVPWIRKPLSSAKTEVSVLPDGRIKLWIEHEVIKGVTPAMIAWWFQHVEGEMTFGGVTATRYRMWHPIDHVSIRYAKRRPDGTIGPGAVIHLHEVFAQNPKWVVNVHTRIEKLDETGFLHCPHKLGIKVAHAEYIFEAVEGGTKYTNWLIAGLTHPIGRLINPLIRRLQFPDDQARAWLTHNVEEVGNFEWFLPALYAAETAKQPS